MSKPETPDRARVRIPPPLLFLALVGLGFLLEHLSPLAPVDWPVWGRIAAAAALALVSGGLSLGGFIAFRREKTPFEPEKPTTAICCQGVFRFTRNPLYLSLVFLLAAIGVVCAALWLLSLTPVLIIALDRLAIQPEEVYLEEKFGDAYLRYKRSVRRWI